MFQVGASSLARSAVISYVKTINLNTKQSVKWLSPKHSNVSYVLELEAAIPQVLRNNFSGN